MSCETLVVAGVIGAAAFIMAPPLTSSAAFAAMDAVAKLIAPASASIDTIRMSIFSPIKPLIRRFAIV